MLEGFADRLHDQMPISLDKGGADMVDMAQNLVPIAGVRGRQVGKKLSKEERDQAGFLRDSITYTVEDTVLHFIAAAYYAGYVEYGTRKMQAEPYMRPTLAVQVPLLAGDLAAAALNALGF